MKPRLGVNIDHVATVRQARRAAYPDPVLAALVAEQAGARQITAHLRVDRRHVQLRDLEVLRRTVQTVLNVEISATDEMLSVAEAVRPDTVTLVPERAEEVTTEGGLDVLRNRGAVGEALARLGAAGIRPAVFIDPEPDQVEACLALGTRVVELNSSAYAEAREPEVASRELERLGAAARRGRALGLEVAAGHGLHYHNVQALVGLGLVAEYNIGHAIVARALFSGFEAAVRDMVALVEAGPEAAITGGRRD
ncbi:pyridoxine 5'-phosphate synthase [Myxococcota bacterium]|nr:pyridoxine 5'-phosphate synthase [Myxococcota bacterium]